MKTGFLFVPVSLVSLVLLAGTSTADQVYLLADFNDKTIDAPIGEGGAAVGEPVEIDDTYMTATVREGPMGSPSLEIEDQHGTYSGTARFEFLGGVELTSGTVVVSADIWLHTSSPDTRFRFLVRKKGGTQGHFAGLYFNGGGTVALADETGYYGFLANYETDQRIRAIIEFDMDAGTYAVWLDGDLVIEDRAHGVAEGGIGSVHVGPSADSDSEGFYSVDVIMVTDYFQAVPAEESSWGRIKHGFR